MRTALTIGNFDGVHLGHVQLVAEARRLVDAGGTRGRVVALAFDPHPLTLLRPESAPHRLTTFADRTYLLKQAGADEVEQLSPTAQFLSVEPDAFINNLCSHYKPSFFVEGPDFHFGKAAKGSPATLRVLADAFGFAAHIVPPVEVPLSDQTIVRASSSVVRSMLRLGRVFDAALILGRRYALRGEVVQGDQRGRTIGFPTCNLSTDCMLPADGVYAATATLPDGTSHPAAINIGTRPTFNGVQRRLEAHLIGAKLELTYGWELQVVFQTFLRDQVRFDSIDRLKTQLSKDCDRAFGLINRSTA